MDGEMRFQFYGNFESRNTVAFILATVSVIDPQNNSSKFGVEADIIFQVLNGYSPKQAIFGA